MATHNNKQGIAKDAKGRSRNVRTARALIPESKFDDFILLHARKERQELHSSAMQTFIAKMWNRHGVVVEYEPDSYMGHRGFSVHFEMCKGDERTGFFFAD